MDQYKKYLPIGTVINLKENNKKFMITGYVTRDAKKSNKIYDYCGCLFPEGVISTKKAILFDHNDIEKVLTLGFSCKEQEELNQKMHELLKKEMPQDEMETLE